jgi:hypothetical protein
MRKIFIYFISIISLAGCGENATQKDDANEKGNLPVSIINNPRTPSDTTASNLGTLVFTDTLHDFGSVKEGEMVSYDFEYTNIGKSAVVITEARASCGCTVPEYTQEPIQPGKKGTMKVTFNSEGKPGPNYKNVTIKSNANPGEQDIAIKAQVN